MPCCMFQSQSAPLDLTHNGTLQTLSGEFPPSRCCTILLEEIVPNGSSVMGGGETPVFLRPT